MNTERAGFAQHALDEFQAVCRTDEDDALCDLLSNLMHLADARGLDFSSELSRANRHYQDELMEADDSDSADAVLAEAATQEGQGNE